MTNIIKNLQDIIDSIKIKSLNYGQLHTLLTDLKKLKDSGLEDIISSLDKKMITKSYIKKISHLSKIAKKRGQTISQMALAWVLRHPNMTSALIGSRTVRQLNECLDSLKNLNFKKKELIEIDKYAKEEKINLWSASSKN